MAKRVFIVHGWDGYPKEGWFPWLKKELEIRGFEVTIPAMPDSAKPKIEKWVPYLAEVVGKADKKTFFVGHSIGCQTILRYLETVNERVGGAVFVAGWFNLSDMETEEEKSIGKPWLETPINFKKVKNTTDKFMAIFSKDDPVVPFEENKKLFRERLNSQIITEDGKKHFSGSDGITELSIALQSILKISK